MKEIRENVDKENGERKKVIVMHLGCKNERELSEEEKREERRRSEREQRYKVIQKRRRVKM